jgi:hypothetical protein
MTFIGKVSNGTVVLPPEAQLPEGTEVRVEALPSGGRNLAERYAGLIGIAEDLPADLARNLDHYVHGQPKRA